MGHQTLTFAECTEAVKDMKLKNSPSLDCLTAEFYSKFWNIFGEIVLKALNEGILKVGLSR